MAYGGPITRSVLWIASAHLGRTLSWAFVVLIPACCLVKIFDDDGEIGPVLACVQALLIFAVPLLVGMSLSFSQLRRTAIIENAGPAIMATSLAYCGVGASLITLVFIRGTLGDAAAFSLFVMPNCAIFCSLTRWQFKKMEHAASIGFPVIFTPQRYDALKNTPGDGN